mmetsp:Transcript_11176/g.24663  ORF Transcript_11176/g.24663 Transcript_11176/m.24663 type:complete len:212 (+) Transcript_11176:52-687(+)
MHAARSRCKLKPIKNQPRCGGASSLCSLAPLPPKLQCWEHSLTTLRAWKRCPGKELFILFAQFAGVAQEHMPSSCIDQVDVVLEFDIVLDWRLQPSQLRSPTSDSENVGRKSDPMPKRRSEMSTSQQIAHQLPHFSQNKVHQRIGSVRLNHKRVRTSNQHVASQLDATREDCKQNASSPTKLITCHQVREVLIDCLHNLFGNLRALPHCHF